jgi:parallel beta-helix repeat protein
VQGNKIGTDASGENAVANEVGVEVIASNNKVLDNLISGNEYSGVEVDANGNTVQGNKIGTDASGEQAVANEAGVEVDGSNNKVLDNLVSGNTDVGVRVFGKANTVQDNLIGTDATGTTPLGNGTGVELGRGADNNTVQGNTIGGSSDGGIVIDGANGNQLIGNFIGVDKTFLHKLANGGTGVEIDNGSSNNTLNGNVVYFSAGDGVWIHDTGSDLNNCSTTASATTRGMAFW